MKLIAFVTILGLLAVASATCQANGLGCNSRSARSTVSVRPQAPRVIADPCDCYNGARCEDLPWTFVFEGHYWTHVTDVNPSFGGSPNPPVNGWRFPSVAELANLSFEDLGISVADAESNSAFVGSNTVPAYSKCSAHVFGLGSFVHCNPVNVCDQFGAPVSFYPCGPINGDTDSWLETFWIHDCPIAPLPPVCPADGCRSDNDCPGDNYCMIESHEDAPINVCHGCPEADPCCEHPNDGGDCTIEGGCDHDSDCPSGSFCKTWEAAPHVCHGCDHSNPCCIEDEPQDPECPADGCHTDDDCPGDNYCMIESHEDAPINVCHGCTEDEPCCDPF